LSIQRDNLLKRLTNVFTQSPTSVLYQLLTGVGVALDSVDPAQIGLAEQFAVSTSSGTYLDKHGADWGVYRRVGESDDSYRQRILAQLPRYASGPTVESMKAIVRAFTGVDPDIFEYGPDSFTMGVSTMGTFGFSSSDAAFNFLVTVYNPNDVKFDPNDLVSAINAAKPARSNAEFLFLGGNAALTGVAEYV
jgi:hypothetical protein